VSLVISTETKANESLKIRILFKHFPISVELLESGDDGQRPAATAGAAGCRLCCSKARGSRGERKSINSRQTQQKRPINGVIHSQMMMPWHRLQAAKVGRGEQGWDAGMIDERE